MTESLKGLDLKRFKVIALWHQNKYEAVILMKSRYPENDPAPWCVEYRGGGRYFETADEAFAYCNSRKFKVD